MIDHLDDASLNLLDALRKFLLATVTHPPQAPTDAEQVEPLRQAPAPQPPSSSTVNLSHGLSVSDLGTLPFKHKWPEYVETFTEAELLVARWQGREYKIQLGYTAYLACGVNRRRITVVVNGYPICEFVGQDASKTCLVASLIRLDGKYVLPDAEIPPPYRGLDVRPYPEIVDGAYAKNRLAVVCKQDDFSTIGKHALLRWTTWTSAKDRKKGDNR